MLKWKIFSIDIVWGIILFDFCKKKKLVFFYKYKVKKLLLKLKNEVEVKFVMVFVESLKIGVDFMLVIEYFCLEFIF